MNMARPHSDDPEAMPTRPPRSLVPGESQASDGFEDRPQGAGTMVLAPRDISGRSTGVQNPGQFDEHEERKFSDFGYDALLKSTAGWGSSSKQGSDAGRPNPNLQNLSLMMAKITILRMRRRTNHAEMLESVMLRGPGASLVEPPGTFVLTGTPEAREREPGIVGKFFGDWRLSMTVGDR